MAEQNGEEKRLLSYKPSPLEAFSGWAGQGKIKMGEEVTEIKNSKRKNIKKRGGVLDLAD